MIVNVLEPWQNQRIFPFTIKVSFGTMNLIFLPSHPHSLNHSLTPFSISFIIQNGIVAIASTDLAMAQFLASLVSMTSSYNPNTYVIFAIYVCILLLHGVVNSMTVRLNGLFNNVSGNYHQFYFLVRRPNVNHIYAI